MTTDILTIALGFAEGFALILSPCILSILPIILASSLVGSTSRSMGIISGFVLSFALLAYFARYLVQFTGIDLNAMRYVAYGVLFIVGFILLSNYLTAKFSQVTQRFIAVLPISRAPRQGFYSGLMLGCLVAIIWTPCAGPILAAVLVQIAIQETSVTSFFTLIAFTLGAAIPMIVIALYGLKIRDAFSFFKRYGVLFRKTLGVIIVLNVVYMLYQENYLISSSAPQTGVRTALYLEKGLWRPYSAPQIAGIDTWINSAPLQLSALRGKVVLVDFWTYSCINCVRTLPHLKAWYKKYHHQGLVIIGVHAPEFEFEKNIDNVRDAVHRYGLDYPVALDNNYVTWRNFSNHYWPAQYLLNKQGDVVYEHFGEGDEDTIENNIRFLLGIDKPMAAVVPSQKQWMSYETPETYLGYARANTSLSPSVSKDADADYHFSSTLISNAWALQGGWRVAADKIVATKANAALKIQFNARYVFIVMGSGTKKPISVSLRLNGKPVNADKATAVENGRLVVNTYALYQILALPKFGSGILEITAAEPGLELYTFTFGS
jgi:cytochrome c biogenesis protein CcdA/thiol-disulfide isomerase/thioredoxin